MRNTVTRGSRTLALMLVGTLSASGCAAGPSLEATLAADLAQFADVDGITNLRVVERPDIREYAYFLVLGTRDDGLAAVGLLGYTLDPPYGLRDSNWDGALETETVTFTADNEGLATGTGTHWTTYAFGIIRDPRITVANVVLETGRALQVSVHQPAYAFGIDDTSKGGIETITFEDADGNVIAGFPDP